MNLSGSDLRCSLWGVSGFHLNRVADFDVRSLLFKLVDLGLECFVVQVYLVKSFRVNGV